MEINDLFLKNKDLQSQVLVTDFFGSVHSIEMSNSSSFNLVEDTSCRGDHCPGSQSDTSHQTSEKCTLHDQFPKPQKKQDDKKWHFTTEFLVSLTVFMVLVGVASMR